MRRIAEIIGVSAVLILICLTAWMMWRGSSPTLGDYLPPNDAIVTYLPSRLPEAAPPLVISSSIDAGFMRPFLLAFQQGNPATSIAYIQSRNGASLARALAACRRGERAADIYLTSSTDHLVRLANENCAETLPSAIGRSAPGGAAWRDQVVAFSVEPAVFVFSRRSNRLARPLPANHTALLEWLRGLTPGRDRVGTYDIVESADGYDFAASDWRQAALYGRILESLGRTDIRLYCCSNVMVDAVDRNEIMFAYNVQLSYAYAAQRSGSRIDVVLPDDYQALQTLSLMVPQRARNSQLAIELAEFLTSKTAREIARRGLTLPGRRTPEALARADDLLAQASVTPLLLSLQDKARRDHLIRQWRAAIRPTLTATDPG